MGATDGRRLGLEFTLRPRGRPPKPKKGGDCVKTLSAERGKGDDRNVGNCGCPLFFFFG